MSPQQPKLKRAGLEDRQHHTFLFGNVHLLFIVLQEFLPENYEHHICEVALKQGEVNVTLRLAISTKEGAKEWLKSLQKSSLATYRVERTYPSSGEKLLCKVCITSHFPNAFLA